MSANINCICENLLSDDRQKYIVIFLFKTYEYLNSGICAIIGKTYS
jgi:hypothetical protein